MATNNLRDVDHANNASDNPLPQLAKDEKEAKRRKKDKGLQFLRLFWKKWRTQLYPIPVW
jgi:hypothetical protein